MKARALFAAVCLMVAATAVLAENGSNGPRDASGKGTNSPGGGYGTAADSWTAMLDRIVTFGNHSSPRLGREAAGYASGGGGTGGNY